MDKMIVVVFDSELKAYEGAKALQDLQREGSINLYAKAVIARDASGKVEVKQQGDMGPVGTTVGLLTGSLIGLIGGPVGVAVGATAGMYGGALFDLASLGVNEDYLYEVEQSLQPGKAAVVAEIGEEWTAPVDMRMETLGGVVYRQTLDQVLNDQIERDVTALEADFAALEAEYLQATGEAKAELKNQVIAARTKLEAAEAKIEASQQEAEAKIESLQEQSKKSQGERKEKLEKRIAELKADQQRRSELLKQAQELTKKALS